MWFGWRVMWVAALVALLASGCAWALKRQQVPGGRYGDVQVLKPSGGTRALVILFPGQGQSPASRQQLALALAGDGAWVAVVDSSHYRSKFRGGMPCRALADDALLLAKALLKQKLSKDYFPPLLVGQGDGADLARAALAGASPGDMAGAVVTSDAGNGAPGCIAPINAVPVTVVPEQVLVSTAKAHFPKTSSAGPSVLPLVEMPVAGSRRLVVVMSGDGGWADLDKGIAEELNRRGISVVGWNSLRYFWKQKTPEQVGADLSRVLESYGRRWQADDIALVGYSFGADVLPFAYPLLPQAQQRQVHFISLLGMSHGADFKVRVGGWLGLGKQRETPVLPALMRVHGVAVQCIHGADEKDSLCRDLQGGRVVQVVERPGGHHFDRDPVKLTQIILDGWSAARITHD
ncbi:AcvB/VirJ family lysyl-phosphatidylglycerol hydrolase [Stenotrophomonas sp. Iso1]|uniref:virulence factor family protein n=1 Tax=Stenotrophomonas sp. Iso1 TaxID=2977283 RepID=UPI002FCCF07D